MAPGTTFVHDFVGIDLPLDAVVAVFDDEATTQRLENIVTRSWIPPLEADLELAAFGPSRTHLHVYGRSRTGVALGDAEQTSLRHRLTVALVRHVRGLIIEDITLRYAAGSLVDTQQTSMHTVRPRQFGTPRCASRTQQCSGAGDGKPPDNPPP